MIPPGYFESAWQVVARAGERKRQGRPIIRDIAPRNFWREFFAALPDQQYTYYDLAKLAGKSYSCTVAYVKSHPKLFARKGRRGTKSLIRVKR